MEENVKWTIVAIIIFVFIVILIISSLVTKSNNKIKEFESKANQYLNIINVRDQHIKRFELLTENQKLEFTKNEAEIKLKSQQWAISELEKYKSTEINNLTKTIEENSIKAAANLLEKWKIEYTAKIRQDATNRSYAVNLGRITEHLVPFHAKFPFNPKDARFIGSPIDLIVFDGLDEEEEVNIYFVEIKTGKSRFSSRQQKIKDAVEKQRVHWHPIKVDDITS